MKDRPKGKPRTPRKLPSRELLLEFFDYNPNTGELLWRERDQKHFKRKGSWATWNTRYANKPALTANNGLGYRYGSVFGVNYLAHRLIYVMMTGETPIDIDHIDGGPSNNKWDNLRSVTRQENMRNAALPNHNTSGRVGVRQEKWGAWSATVKISQANITLGYFKDFEGACACRQAAEEHYGFHKNHGRKNEHY